MGFILAAFLGGLCLLALLAAAVGAAPEPAVPAGPVPPPTPPPFYWVRPAEALPVPASLQPNLPDLGVQWIERAPRYHRYCLDYSRGLPELCPGTEDDQRFPLSGEAVTLTAHVANQGLAASPAVEARWQLQAPGSNHLDATVVTTVTLPPLQPGATATLILPWSWAATPHTFTLTLDPSSTLSETTRSNNRRSHRSDALYLDVAVHPLVDAAFARRANLAGSWSFADWLQAQFDALNGDLAGAGYPAQPGGVPDRVRIDRILVTEDVGGDTVTSTLDFDGRWTFRVEADDPDTLRDESDLSAERYARTYANAVDWGLVHELTHQLGAIDLYQLNVAGSYQNQVVDGDGRPLLLGFQWPNPGLMGGGDRDGYAWTAYSQHTARALASNAGLRRGYFGEYLFDVPAESSLVVLDNQGLPLPGAQVDLFQTTDGSVPAQPFFSGTIDGQGRLALPQRPVPLGGLTTATGHTLAPNPFGAVDVVGLNGQLLVQVSQQGQRFYTWWPLTDFNLAYWDGLQTYQRILATHLAPATPGWPAAPGRLDGRVDGTDVTLWWSPSSSPNVMAYRVYRGQEPDYLFALEATTPDVTFLGTSAATARYAVTAVDSQGRESAFSPVFRAQRTVLPIGVAVDPADGRRVVLDRHDGALIGQQADGRWIGRQGSVHLGLTGSEALARDDAGHLLAPVTSEDRLVVLDAVLNPVNWLGRQGFVTGTLDGPAGLAVAGQAFSVDFKPAGDAGTLGLASYDAGTALSGDLPVLLQGVTLGAGRFGNGVRVDRDDRLLYDAAGHWDAGQGSVQLWVKPRWPWDDGQEHVLIEVGPAGSDSGASYHFRLAKADWNGLYAWLEDGTRSVGLYADVGDWRAGTWHHLAVAWQAAQSGTDYRRYTLWLDRMLRDSQVLRRPVAGRPDLLSVGAGLDGYHQADAMLDELHVSGVARLGNSQQVRLLVSQSEASRIDVLDWLGNPISRFGQPGSGPTDLLRPRELLASGDRVLVADGGNGRVLVLAFDGTTLSPLATWNDGLLAPRGLALLSDGQLLVSDEGDDQVKLMSANGHLLRRWTGPSDGHPGAFLAPSGLAPLPDGSVLVADMGNGRVVRVEGPLSPASIFLPLVRAGSP